MDISLVPDNILTAWIISNTEMNRNNFDGLMFLTKLSDADKISNMTAFLEARVISNTAAAAALSDSIQDQIDALNADTAICNGLLGS